jgi:hypothetical protein
MYIQCDVAESDVLHHRSIWGGDRGRQRLYGGRKVGDPPWIIGERGGPHLIVTDISAKKIICGYFGIFKMRKTAQNGLNTQYGLILGCFGQL